MKFMTCLIKSLFFLALMLALSAFTPSAQAVVSYSKAGSEHTLKTIIVNNYHPYTFINEKGQPDGFSVEIARAVTKAMDLELLIRVDKWDQAMKELENGDIDLLPMMAASPERDKIFDFSVPHTIAYDAIFRKKGGADLRTLKDLSGKTVVVMNRDAAHSYLLSSGLSKIVNITLVDSLPEALRQLDAGKGDAAIMPKLVGIVTAKRLNLPGIETSPQIIDGYTRPFSFAVKGGNQPLLERLNQGLNIIKSSGEYDVIYKKWFGSLEDPQIDIKTAIKFGSVVALILFGFIAWNTMLSRQVKSKTRHLEIEIAEHKLAEEELQQKNAELERFTYTVSHDLKSPLITIKGFAGSLERDLLNGNYQRMADDLKRICDAADKMSDLLRDLLDLSTIGRVVKEPEQVDMNLLVADVLALLAIPLKSHNLTVEVQPGLPTIPCDRRRIAEVVQNLLENAINFMGNQKEPFIKFGVQEADGLDTFFVQDNGIGIDGKYHQIIFGLFNKLDAKSSGTGVGLALVKRIVEVHGGHVWVESEGVGMGSRFCFTIG